MRLTGLQPLYRSMCDQRLGRVKFRYQLNHLTFECLFFADTTPFELVMGCLGHNFAIFMNVHEGFAIRPYIEPAQTYWALRDALFRNAGSATKLEPGVFFSEFNRHIPQQASPHQVPTPNDVVRYYPDIEEAAKRWFLGWRDNSKLGKQVTRENLAKTRLLLGQRAHDFSLRRNQSTCWTPDPAKARATFIPE